jgi:Asp-tRNA(Asn)/Glu-tRNA(Gln) amidotransferase A subunit family amidase
MARNPADATLLFGVLVDETPAAALPDGLRGVRIGLCPDMHLVALSPEIETAYRDAAEAAAAAGAELVDVALPEAAGAYQAFGAVQRCEALRTHTEAGLWPARRAEYGADVLGRLEMATNTTLSDYLNGITWRERLRAGMHRVFAHVDLLLTPVTAGPPAPIGHERVMHLGEEIEFRELVMSYTVPQDLTGLPACTVRAGFDELGVPTAVQLTGPPWSEWRALAAAGALYDATADVQARRPDLAQAASLG